MGVNRGGAVGLMSHLDLYEPPVKSVHGEMADGDYL